MNEVEGGEDGFRRLTAPGNSSSSTWLEPWAVKILKAEEAYQPTAGRKQRIWLALAHPGEKRAAPVFPRLVVAGVLLVFGGGTAIASAALGKWPQWATRVYENVVGGTSSDAEGRDTSTTGESPRIGRRIARGPASAATTPVPDDVATATELVAAARTTPTPAPSPSPLPATMNSPHREFSKSRHTRHAAAFNKSNRATGSASASAATKPPAGEDAGPVLAAMRALHRDRNPARARVLLDAYMSEHPAGGLAEEALAISIEAAVANRDADAVGLASRYLRLYPNGTFHKLAQGTLTAAGSTQPRFD